MSTPITDQKVALNTVVVWVAWSIGLGLILLHLFGVIDVGWCALGLAAVCLGSVREVMGRIAELERSQMAAFELGREAGVRSIRGAVN